MMAVLEVFHHRIAIWITGMTENNGEGREWEWDLVDAALELTGIYLMREYLRRQQAKIAEYVAGRPIYELCTREERMYGSSRFLMWW